MDSQGRSRLIIGGLTLAAVLLVITLLLTQQDRRVPVAVESPLTGEPTPAQEAAATIPVTATGTVTSETPAVQAESPLGAPTSPLAEPGSAAIAASSAISANVPVSSNASSTASITMTGSAVMSVAATSTVTVSLVEPERESYGFEVLASYPHDPEAYTQGLQYVDGVLYEGTGLYGRSTLRRVNLESGAVEQQISIPDQYFGEGIYVLDDRIYQLTWQSNVAFLYDRATFDLVGQFSYPTEGWGLTYDGQDLLMSDGSATIFRRDPATFEEVGRIEVSDGGEPVNMLNELEYINGEIWANIWQTDEIIIIDPADGKVTGHLDLAGLLPREAAANAEVLNGIAYDAENDRLFVTGKFWPLLFEIKLVPR